MSFNLFFKPIVISLKEYGRGIVGGLLFSLPLLYTMEVWHEAYTAKPSALFVYFLVTLVLLLGYNRYAGMRKDATWKEIFFDSIEESGLGIIISFLILLLLRRIHFEMDLYEIMSMVILEGMVFAIGISVGTAQLGANKGNENNQGYEEDDKAKQQQTPQRNKTIEFIILSACGAVLVGSNVGATMEIVVIGLETTPLQVLLIALISIILAVAILFFLSFKGQLQLNEDILFTVSWAAATSFVISLAVSAFILWFFGRFDGASFAAAVNETVVLGLANILGASAGKLLIKGSS